MGRRIGEETGRERNGRGRERGSSVPTLPLYLVAVVPTD